MWPLREPGIATSWLGLLNHILVQLPCAVKAPWRPERPPTLRPSAPEWDLAISTKCCKQEWLLASMNLMEGPNEHGSTLYDLGRWLRAKRGNSSDSVATLPQLVSTPYLGVGLAIGQKSALTVL